MKNIPWIGILIIGFLLFSTRVTADQIIELAPASAVIPLGSSLSLRILVSSDGEFNEVGVCISYPVHSLENPVVDGSNSFVTDIEEETYDYGDEVWICLGGTHATNYLSGDDLELATVIFDAVLIGDVAVQFELAEAYNDGNPVEMDEIIDGLYTIYDTGGTPAASGTVSPTPTTGTPTSAPTRYLLVGPGWTPGPTQAPTATPHLTPLPTGVTYTPTVNPLPDSGFTRGTLQLVSALIILLCVGGLLLLL